MTFSTGQGAETNLMINRDSVWSIGDLLEIEFTSLQPAGFKSAKGPLVSDPAKYAPHFCGLIYYFPGKLGPSLLGPNLMFLWQPTENGEVGHL